MPKLMRKAILLAKIETVSGTDAVPTAAANAMLVRSVTPRPFVADSVSRDLIRAYFGNSESLQAGEHSEIDIEVELAGSGTAGTVPAFSPLLRACGLSETITAGSDVKYAPITGSNETATLYFYLDGLLHKMAGCLGTVALNIEAKQIPFMSFKFIGAYSPVTDVAHPVADYSKFLTPRHGSSANTPAWSLHGFSGPLQSLQIDLANQIGWRALIGAETAEQTDRKPVGNVVLDLGTVAAQDWWAKVRSGTLGALSITHGTTAGNIVKIDAPKVQLTNPQYTDSNGRAMLNASLGILPGVGNDELVLTFK